MNKIDNGNQDTSQEWKTLSLLGLGLCFIGFGRNVLPILFASAIQDIELAPDNIGDVGGITSIVLGLFAIFAGRVSDEIGHRKILIAAIVLYSLLIGLWGTFQALIVLIVIQMLMGALNGCYVPASFATVSAVSKPSRRGRNLGLLQAFALLGRFLAIIATGVLLSLSGSWSSVFWIIAIPGLIIGALLYFLFDGHEDPQAVNLVGATQERNRWFEALSSRNIVVCIFAMLCATTCVFVLGAYVLFFAADAAAFGLLTMTIVCGGFLGQISWPALSDKRGRRPLAILGFVGAAASALWLFATPLPSALPLFVCSYFCFGNMALISGPIAAESAPAGLVSSAIGVVVGSAAILGGLAAVYFDPSGIMSGVRWIGISSVTLGIPACLFLKETAPLETVEKPEEEDGAEGRDLAKSGEKPETEDSPEGRVSAKSGKNLIVAYVLWILFPLGAHRFYLGRTASGVAIVLLSLSFFLSRFFLVSLPFPLFLDPETIFLEFFTILEMMRMLDTISRALLLIILCWWLIDAFRIPKLARRDSKAERNSKAGKSLTAAYVFWLLLGVFGAHRFYFGRRRSALALLLLGLFTLAIFLAATYRNYLFLPPTSATFDALDQLYHDNYNALGVWWMVAVWWIVDAFLMPKWARRR
ncbi:MAG: MFS transporter [Gammaproteobacteria bacterium]|nr:MFS transporter [Gammaproteobacteria bacterium]